MAYLVVVDEMVICDVRAISLDLSHVVEVGCGDW
jgi:hypothetical protein